MCPARRLTMVRITPSGYLQLAQERGQWQPVDATPRGIWSRLQFPTAAGDPALDVTTPNRA
jgi:hypothetical protein